MNDIHTYYIKQNKTEENRKHCECLYFQKAQIITLFVEFGLFFILTYLVNLVFIEEKTEHFCKQTNKHNTLKEK